MAKLKETGKTASKSSSSEERTKKGSADDGGGGGGARGGSGGDKSGGDKNIRLGEDAERLFKIAGGVGGVSLLVSLGLGFSGDAERLSAFLHSYTVAFMWGLSIVLGALWWVTLQHLVGAHWSVVARRVGELFAASMPMLGLLVLPILIPVMIGQGGVLFPWADPAVVASDHILQHKSPYLNTTFFLVRCLIYFGFWSILARWYFKTSLAQDQKPTAEQISGMRAVSAPSMIAISLTLTFCAVDFLMSADKLFFSTIFGVYYFAGCVIAFHSTLALSLMWLQSKGRLVGMVTVEHYHDIGKMMFAFIVFWSYIAFSQFMLIWYANIPEETQWFKPRLAPSGWVTISWILLLGHFAIPFLGLISRQVKRNRLGLAFWAVWLLVIQWIDMYWILMPQFDPHGPPFQLLDLTCLVAVAGLLIATAAYQARNVNLVPTKDPRLAKSLAFENI